MSISVQTLGFTNIIDIDRSILYQMGAKDLLIMCGLNTYFEKIICNEDFWRQKYLMDFGSTKKKTAVLWKTFYLSKSLLPKFVWGYRDKTTNAWLRFPLKVSNKIESAFRDYTNTVGKNKVTIGPYKIQFSTMSVDGRDTLRRLMKGEDY